MYIAICSLRLSDENNAQRKEKEKSYFEIVPRTFPQKVYPFTLPSFLSFVFLSPCYATIACTKYMLKNHAFHIIFPRRNGHKQRPSRSVSFSMPRHRPKSQQEYYNASTVVQEKVGKILHTQATGRRSDKTYGKILQANGKGPPPQNHPSRCHLSAFPPPPPATSRGRIMNRPGP